MFRVVGLEYMSRCYLPVLMLYCSLQRFVVFSMQCFCHFESVN